MNRLARIFLGVVILGGLLSAGRLALPGGAFACSCAITHVRDFIGDPEYVIVAGIVGNVRPGGNVDQLATFAVQRVFQGAVPNLQMDAVGGGGGDCTIHLEDGMQLIAVATIEDNRLRPGLCAPFGDLRDASGQAVLAQVREALGPGVDPGGDDPEPAPGPQVDLVAISLIAVGGLVALVLLVVALAVVGRNRSTGAEP